MNPEEMIPHDEALLSARSEMVQLWTSSTWDFMLKRLPDGRMELSWQERLRRGGRPFKLLIFRCDGILGMNTFASKTVLLFDQGPNFSTGRFVDGPVDEGITALYGVWLEFPHHSADGGLIYFTVTGPLSVSTLEWMAKQKDAAKARDKTPSERFREVMANERELAAAITEQEERDLREVRTNSSLSAEEKANQATRIKARYAAERARRLE